MKKNSNKPTVNKASVIKYSSDTNCLSCKRFVSCTKSKKAFNYVCDSFKPHKKIVNFLDFDTSTPEVEVKSTLSKLKNNKLKISKIKEEPILVSKKDKKKYKVDNSDDEADGFNIEKLVREVEEAHARGISPDLKIDDRDLKEAPNFFTYSTSDKYVGYKLFPKQIEVGINLYNDYCTNRKCTDVKYAKNIATHDYDNTASATDVVYGKILDRITMLENGVCPKCKQTRADGWAAGIYHPYIELAGLAGQRCVAFDTYCLTERGMVKIGELFENVDYGFTNTELMLDNGTGSIVTATKLYKAKAERPNKVTFSDGTRITGTEDHPILTHLGMVKTRNIQRGKHYIPVYLGQECWGINSLYDEELLGSVNSYCMSYRLRTADRETNIRYLNLLFSIYGTIEKEKYITFNFGLLTHVNAEEVKFVLQNLGVAAYIEQTGVTYRVHIEGPAILKLILALDLKHNLLNDDLLHEVSDYISYNEAPFYFLKSEANDVTRLGNPDYYILVTNVEHLLAPCITYDFHIPDGHKFFSNGIVSHNSGKSALLSIMSTYNIHRYMKLQNAPKLFNLFNNTTLHGVFIATTMAQARDSLFDPIRDIISDSPWYTDYHSMLDHYAKKHGEELYKFKDTMIEYRPRRLAIYPSVPNTRTLRGRALFLGGIDEIGHFDSNKSSSIKLNADNIHAAMKNSFLSVSSATRNLRSRGFYNIPEPLLGNISSPVSRYDKICRLVDDSKDSVTMYGFRYSVFEFNPTITEEDLADIKRTNPENFKTNYLAIPPRASSAFIHDIKIVRACIDQSKTNMFAIKQKTSLSASGSEITKAWVKFLRRDSQTPRFMAIDAGETSNAFAICVMSLQDGLPIVDGIGEVTPEPGKPLNFNNIYNKVIVPIVEALNVKFVAADRWNSAQILSDLEAEHEVGQAYHKVSYDDLLAVKTAMTDGLVIVPKLEMKIKEAMKMASKNYPFCFIGKPMAHFVVQCLTVEEILGKSVIKGEKKTDDMFRAFVLCYAKIMDPELQEMFLDDNTAPPRSPIIAASASYGSGAQMSVGNSNLGAVASAGSANVSGPKIFVGR